MTRRLLIAKSCTIIVCKAWGLELILQLGHNIALFLKDTVNSFITLPFIVLGEANGMDASFGSRVMAVARKKSCF